jgi:hypothetical protein
MAELRTWTDLKRQIDECAKQQGGYEGIINANIDSLTVDQMFGILRRKRSILSKEVIGAHMTLEECIKQALYTSFLV